LVRLHLTSGRGDNSVDINHNWYNTEHIQLNIDVNCAHRLSGLNN
jgi:hypothetical protein